MDAYSTPNIAQMQMVMGVATAIEAYPFPLVMLRTAEHPEGQEITKPRAMPP
jgi:hypothetical protein